MKGGGGRRRGEGSGGRGEGCWGQRQCLPVASAQPCPMAGGHSLPSGFPLSPAPWLALSPVFSIFQSFVVNNQFKAAPSLSFCNSENPLNYIVGGKQWLC